jgi:hypothetical protein
MLTHTNFLLALVLIFLVYAKPTSTTTLHFIA